ncbi:hypothetical protein [Streptomyces sp. NBC_01353]|uniref:hypothetical protein n=1 Tax=Streptomyces sp. NBC_01353 TaxID=2903835 RepID=UPI002E354F6F|nr:hypothetical protein [Streptomyces sp. NBC_01353]
MDVERVIEELYGLLPEEFTAARDAYVAEARKAGDTDAVKAISGLRRPTTAAWVSNLFVRARPADVDRLLALGETLREAHRTLDPVKMREASGQRHKVVAALAREAAGPARDAGQPVSDAVLHDVEQIFHAVLAGPDVAEQWATGRLVKAPEVPVGFGEVIPEVAAPRPEPSKPSKSPKTAKPSKSPKPTAKRASKAEAERRERRERDRTDAEAAAAETRARDEALHRAEEERKAAQADVAAADESVTELERQLKEAKQEKRAAQDAATEAEKAVKEAGRAARDAHRAADRARNKVERSAD